MLHEGASDQLSQDLLIFACPAEQSGKAFMTTEGGRGPDIMHVVKGCMWLKRSDCPPGKLLVC